MLSLYAQHVYSKTKNFEFSYGKISLKNKEKGKTQPFHLGQLVDIHCM